MNKRHYEHTLPNIRGSLSNTYQPLSVNALPFHFKYVFNLPGQFVTARPIPSFKEQLPAVLTDILFRLATAYALVIGFTSGRKPFAPPAVNPVPAVFIQIAAEFRLSERRVFRRLRNQFDDMPVRFERLLPVIQPAEQMVNHRHLITEHEPYPGLVEGETFKRPLRSSVFSLSGIRSPERRFLLRLPPDPFLFHDTVGCCRVKYSLGRERTCVPQFCGDFRCHRLH